MTPAIRLLVSVVLAMLAGDAATAEDLSANFPNRPIRIIVPFPAGGPSDIVARLIGQKMSEDWGQPVVIDNRPGGNTIIGAQAAAKAAPDGYTLFMAIDSTLVMNQYLHKTLPYDPLGDFVPITLTAKTVSVLAVPAADGPRTVKELIARAKARPDRLNYGAGTITAQLMGHLFHKAAGLDIAYVPFKGTPETVNALLTGSVQLIYAANQIVAPLIASGVPAPRAGCRNSRSILSRGNARSILSAYSHTDNLVSLVVRNENGRSVPAAVLREFLGNNNGMRCGVIGRRKNRSRFVRIPAAVVNVEIKPASFSRNLCLR